MKKKSIAYSIRISMCIKFAADVGMIIYGFVIAYVIDVGNVCWYVYYLNADFNENADVIALVPVSNLSNITEVI